MSERFYNVDAGLQSKNIFLKGYFFSKETLRDGWTFKIKAHVWPSHKISALLFKDDIVAEFLWAYRPVEVGIRFDSEMRVKNPSSSEGLRDSTYNRNKITVFGNTWSDLATLRVEASYNLTENHVTFLTRASTTEIKQILLIHRKKKTSNVLCFPNPATEKCTYRFGKIQPPSIGSSLHPKLTQYSNVQINLLFLACFVGFTLLSLCICYFFYQKALYEKDKREKLKLDRADENRDFPNGDDETGSIRKPQDPGPKPSRPPGQPRPPSSKSSRQRVAQRGRNFHQSQRVKRFLK